MRNPLCCFSTQQKQDATEVLLLHDRPVKNVFGFDQADQTGELPKVCLTDYNGIPGGAEKRGPVFRYHAFILARENHGSIAVINTGIGLQPFQAAYPVNFNQGLIHCSARESVPSDPTDGGNIRQAVFSVRYSSCF